MDEFNQMTQVKDEAPRRHPEDAYDSDIGSDLDNLDSLTFEDDGDDEHTTHNTANTTDFDIPGTGPNDMPIFKSSSKLTGSYQTVGGPRLPPSMRTC